MKIGSSEWNRLIRDGAGKFGIEIDATLLDQFAVYAHEMLHWAGKINLTRITDPVDIAVKHFLDSILPIQFIQPERHLLDMGAGAGFPGIPLKMVMPSLRVTLIDSVRKKVSFMQHILRTLSLKQVWAIHARLGDFQPGRTYDLIVSRAFAPLDKFIPLAIPRLADGGTILAWKGHYDQAQEEYNQFLAKKHLYASHMKEVSFQTDFKTYVLPIVNAERTVVLIRIAGKEGID